LFEIVNPGRKDLVDKVQMIKQRIEEENNPSNEQTEMLLRWVNGVF